MTFPQITLLWLSSTDELTKNPASFELSMKIGLVGPCTAGKSTVGSRLRELGYEVRQIAQEHSYVPNMWKRISNPDILIFLEVSYENTLSRRNLSWKKSDYEIQLHRLRHAKEFANLSINTDLYSVDEVVVIIIDFINSKFRDSDY